MYLPVALLVWLATLPFVISDSIVTLTSEAPVPLTPSRGYRLANTRPPSSSTVPSMDLSSTGSQSSTSLSPHIMQSISVNSMPTPSSLGPSHQKSRTRTQGLSYSEVTSATFGTASTFKSTAQLPAQEQLHYCQLYI